MRVLVTGAGGLVGTALAEHCTALGDQVFACDHKGLDISNLHQVGTMIREQQPEFVINCAAWTDVDGCELDREKANAVNATGPENLAKSCREVGAGLITISTDYVFDGQKGSFYTQRDHPNPISVYGVSKLDGERRAQTVWARTIVVRTGFVFGPGGKTFLSRVVDFARQGGPIKAIGDAWGTPTYAWHLALRLRELAIVNLPGTFHVVNSGAGASYEEFVRDALEVGGFDAGIVESVSMDSLQRPATRPRNSRLSCLLSEAIGLAPLPPWSEALADFVKGQIQQEIAVRH